MKIGLWISEFKREHILCSLLNFYFIWGKEKHQKHSKFSQMSIFYNLDETELKWLRNRF